MDGSVHNDDKARKAASHLFTCMVKMLVPELQTFFPNVGTILPIEQVNDPLYLLLEVQYLVQNLEKCGKNLFKTLIATFY